MYVHVHACVRGSAGVSVWIVVCECICGCVDSVYVCVLRVWAVCMYSHTLTYTMPTYSYSLLQGGVFTVSSLLAAFFASITSCLSSPKKLA